MPLLAFASAAASNGDGSLGEFDSGALAGLGFEQMLDVGGNAPAVGGERFDLAKDAFEDDLSGAWARIEAVGHDFAVRERALSDPLASGAEIEDAEDVRESRSESVPDGSAIHRRRLALAVQLFERAHGRSDRRVIDAADHLALTFQRVHVDGFGGCPAHAESLPRRPSTEREILESRRNSLAHRVDGA